jgi:hypothetical protein
LRFIEGKSAVGHLSLFYWKQCGGWSQDGFSIHEVLRFAQDDNS